MSFEEKKKYGSMDKAFKAAKDEAELVKDVQASIDKSHTDRFLTTAFKDRNFKDFQEIIDQVHFNVDDDPKDDLTAGNDFINKRRESLSSRNDGDEMSDADFELLKQDLEMTMLKLNYLQGKYRKQVGKDFILPI